MFIAPDQYLSPEESADIDTALLSSSEKFLTWLTISSQRLLKAIAQDYGTGRECGQFVVVEFNSFYFFRGF